jgi:glycosyltransferase involved in cell wall biosynthesis
MKIIIAHNRYTQPGGEDIVVEQERALLARAGHSVIRYERSNDEFDRASPLTKIRSASQTIWSSAIFSEFQKILVEERPDVVHVHNTWAAISPAIYWACRQALVPVVQTLHNFRLLCPAGTFYRNGQICTECLQQTLLRSVAHRCYHDSLSHTSVLAAMLTTHRALGTYRESVDRYIALTEFAREKYVAGGIPADRIVVKPNFLASDPHPSPCPGEGAIFVGRLTEDKGCWTLLHAWQQLSPSVVLQIVGEGALHSQLETYASANRVRNVQFCGLLPREEVLARIKRSALLILPSEWYELFPMTLIEAFACGVPVLVSNSPGLRSIVPDGYVGRLFQTGSASDLAQKVGEMLLDRGSLSRMARNAREEFERKYTASRNYPLLMEIYAQVVKPHHNMEPSRDSASAQSCLYSREQTSSAAKLTA